MAGILRATVRFTQTRQLGAVLFVCLNVGLHAVVSTIMRCCVLLRHDRKRGTRGVANEYLVIRGNIIQDQTVNVCDPRQ